MLLPKQSPPVERKTKVVIKASTKDVRPQMTCACRTDVTPNTVWCIIGRSIYNTKELC